MLFIGSLLYISVLLINAVAILSQDRFLARSAFVNSVVVVVVDKSKSKSSPIESKRSFSFSFR